MLERRTVSSEDVFLGKKSAAAALDVSVRTIESHLSEIPHFKLGAKILFRRSELFQWMERFRQPTQDLDKTVDEVLQKMAKN